MELHQQDRIESAHVNPSGNGSARVSALHSREQASGNGSAVAHILVATRLHESEREAVMLALRMAAAQRARVTLLHVLVPFTPPSVHWLDAIDNLHRALNEQPRDSEDAIQKGRSEIVTFLNCEIPREVREPVAIQIECRVGDVASEIAAFAEEQAVDLVFLCDRPPSWRPSFLSSLSQRIAQLNSKPIVFGRQQTNSKRERRIETRLGWDSVPT